MFSLRLIFESFRFAFNSLVVNQLRTFLSLLGITIGIFCIISVFTVIDSLERAIRKNMDKLGTNVIYIQKWPWTPPPGESEYPWWKYLNRPIPKMDEAQEILRRSNLTQYAVFNYGFNRTVQAGANKADNVMILGASAGLIDAWNLKVEYGRPLSDEEFNSAPGFAMIGSELGSQLFPRLSPVGKSVKNRLRYGILYDLPIRLLVRDLSIAGAMVQNFQSITASLFSSDSCHSVHCALCTASL